MAAKFFVVPYQCVVVSGLAVPGATLTFYQTGSTNKLPVYTTSAMTTELTNPVAANGSGHIPDTYLSDAYTYRVVFKDKNGTVLEDVDPYIPGTTVLGITITTATGSSVSTRAALAAISPVVADQVAFLTENGREGMFVFDSADLSAEVTADTGQGVYVAPASAGTGASGSWNRVGSEAPLIPQNFYEATDPDFYNAMDRGLNFIKSQATPGYGFGPGGRRLFVPAGAYELGQALDIYCTTNLCGEGVGENGGASTVLKFTGATSGIRIQSNTTSGASGTRAADGYRGDGTIIERLFIEGSYNHGVTAEAENHGIHLRGRATIQECFINLFRGDGIYANASAGSGGATEGNVNNAYVSRVTISGSRNGVFFQGADTNAGTFIMVNALANRRWGIYDNSFLGNGHLSHHTSGNGVVNVGSGIPYTQVSYTTKIYSLVVGGNPANAPSGTTADTADWYYVRAGGVTATAPAWSAVLSVRDGGPYFSSGSPFYGCYSENDQGVSQVINSGYMDGRRLFSEAKGGGMFEKLIASPGPTNPATRQLSGGLRVVGDNPSMSGPAGIEIHMFAGGAYIQTLDRDGGNVFKPLILNSSTLGFFGAGGAAKPTIAGSRGGNAALASLLTALAGFGLLTDGTTA